MEPKPLRQKHDGNEITELQLPPVRSVAVALSADRRAGREELLGRGRGAVAAGPVQGTAFRARAQIRAARPQLRLRRLRVARES